jgi:tRNA U38,U39,U40 pseudouridine synthase TruA
VENGSVPENGDASCEKNPNAGTTTLVSKMNSEQAIPQGVSELQNSSLGLALEPADAIFEMNPNEGLNCSQATTLVPNSNLKQTFSWEGSELNNNLAPPNDGAPTKSSFQYGEKERDRFNNILKQFVGTHNFHNLTTHIKAEDPTANRYILSFEASDIFTINGMGFVK